MGLESGQGDTGKAGSRAEAASDGTTSGGRAADIDLRRLAQDWITLWESEVTALAADPEMREAWQAAAAIWAGAMTAALQAMPRGSTSSPAAPRDERSPRGAGSPETPRAAPAAAAPDPRDAEIERLARHIDALERRLADVERSSSGGPRRTAPRGRGGKSRPAE
ncbi:MAG: hypothetical protein U1E70_06800 [Acetobacteraceae bacterium]